MTFLLLSTGGRTHKCCTKYEAAFANAVRRKKQSFNNLFWIPVHLKLPWGSVNQFPTWIDAVLFLISLFVLHFTTCKNSWRDLLTSLSPPASISIIWFLTYILLISFLTFYFYVYLWNRISVILAFNFKHLILFSIFYHLYFFLAFHFFLFIFNFFSNNSQPFLSLVPLGNNSIYTARSF